MNEMIKKVRITKSGKKSKGIENVQNWLVHFGYLEGGSYEADKVDDQTSAALRKYQTFHNLKDTGDFDEATQEAMAQSRCGMPDMVGGIAFNAQCSWNRWNLTYAFDSGTSDIPAGGEFQAIRNAFRTWANAIPLTFSEVGLFNQPDIRIGWRRANDPDLSMVGRAIAHADFPPGCSILTNSLPKPLHFDDEEHTWAVGSVMNAFDVESVALHEIGHIIGLGHSGVAGSVMSDSISSNTVRRALTADDIAGAQALYPSQNNWRWCNKCQGLFFAGNPNPRCPAGGSHDQTGSGNYFLAHNMNPTSGWQSNWRWCNKCQGLFFAGNPNPVCPAGGQHDGTGSGNYSLLHNAPAFAPGQQNNWRWCFRCQGLFFGGNPGPVCPAGGPHLNIGSGNYSLIHR